MLIEKVIISVHYPLSTEIKIMKRFLFLICILCGISAAQARDRQCFDKDWRFFLGDSIAMAKADFDDSRWRKLDVPHDWAIEGDFYVSNPSVLEEALCLGVSVGTVRSLQLTVYGLQLICWQALAN